MSYFWEFMFVLHIVCIAKAEPSLKIVKNVNGTEVPVSSILQESAGTNLTLFCKLFDNATTSNTTKYFDNEISWGWKRPNIQFKNVTDLQTLALNISKPLLQFFNHSDLNQATITFHPLSVSDSGIFFCMSLKYKLFNIVTVDVVRGKSSADISRTPYLWKWTWKPKSSCTTTMFTCNSRTSCIKYQHVCDKVKDCPDGSDENVYLCGRNPCAGKLRCFNGRCLSRAHCCDYRQSNNSCILDGRPLCCSEINQENKPNIINSKTSNTFGIHALYIPSYNQPILHNNGWSSNTGNRFKGVGEYPKLNNINNPVWKNSYGTSNIAGSKVNYVPKLSSFSTTTTTSKGSFKMGKKALGFLLAPFVGIGVIVRCMRRKCKKPNDSSNNENANRSPGNLYQEIYIRDTQGTTQQNANSDLPPTYHETISKAPETSTLLVNGAHR